MSRLPKSTPINAKDFRVPAEKKVSLKEWPTLLEPVYKSGACGGRTDGMMYVDVRERKRADCMKQTARTARHTAAPPFPGLRRSNL
jgi:hypothetical protein